MLRLVLNSHDLDPKHLARNCSTDSFDFDYRWKATRADLVARWKRTVSARRQKHQLWRDRAKASCLHKTQYPRVLPPGPDWDLVQKSVNTTVIDSWETRRAENAIFAKGSSRPEFTTSIQPYVQDVVRCPRISDVNKYTLNSAQEGLAIGTSSTRLLQDHRSVGPMEMNRRASADSSSSHCQRNETHNGLTPEQLLEKKKAEGVALVMAVVREWIDKRLNIITYAYETAGMSENPAADGGSTGSQDSNGSGQSERPSRRSKRQFDEGDLNNSSSGGDENGRDNGGNKRAKKDTDTKKRFACPYYKHDPRTHRRERTCCGPGWDSIHRLKEHLYRKHRLPKHACARCGDAFDGTNELNAHLRADTPCKKVDMGPMDGVDEEMEAKLKVRKAYTGLTEEQKWREIYLILFPKANRETVPSPYYDGNDGLGLNKSAAEWKKNERLIRKELPKYVQKTIERKFDHLTVDMLSGLTDIVRDGLHELLGPGSGESPADSPVGSPKPTAAAEHHHQPEERPHAAAATTATVDQDEGDHTASLDLSLLLGEGEQLFLPEFGSMDFPDHFGFDSFADCSTLEVDSGYASGSTGRGVALM